ncbi:MAG: PepSY domain-containing protein [Chitinophagaceae bacterium]|nr:MAG: PepSY domain-containing protein [Chitinophagaceae bacterium]
MTNATRMNQRNYNIFFHTHTISGIIISLVLFVIFFAGSFAFFRSQISHWQHNQPDRHAVKLVDYNRMTDSVTVQLNPKARDLSFYSDPYSSTIYFSASAPKDTTLKGGQEYADIDANTFVRHKAVYEQAYDLGEFLYRLHYLAQIPYPYGYYLSGGVAFIFLFALITGLLVHWQKIVSNFYVFRPWEKLKTLWTDLHTALGVISFPYMLIFAITGANLLISAPLFNDQVNKFESGFKKQKSEDGIEGHNVPYLSKLLEKPVDLNAVADAARMIWGDSVVVNHLEVINYGDQSMQVHVGGVMDPSLRFAGEGELIFNVADGKILKHTDPRDAMSYSVIANELLYRLHYATYGGLATKFLYFILGLVVCIVIVSGVRIWLVARDKDNVPAHKRMFNNWLARIYMAVAAGMLPVTAAAFIVVKFFPDEGMYFIFQIYFLSWLAVSVVLILTKDLNRINKYSLLATALVGSAIPVINGFVTGNWMWISHRSGYKDVFLIDLLWLIIALCCFIAWRRTGKKPILTKAAV